MKHQLKSIFRAALAVTLTFLFVIGAIVLYLNVGQEREPAVETASRLPGPFVEACQQAAETTGIPWNYFAAYYQVALEQTGDQGDYPSKANLLELAGELEASKNGSFEKKLKKMKGRDTAATIIDRAEALGKSSFLFSTDYQFPIVTKEVSYSDTWLAARDDGERQHLGTDIFAPEGTPVYASTGGKLVRIGWDNLGGNRVGLRGDDGIYYYFAHLHSYAPGLEEGCRVQKGNLLGYVGHTGNAQGTPSHLHFGMQLGGEDWVNPYNFLVYWELNSPKDKQKPASKSIPTG